MDNGWYHATPESGGFRNLGEPALAGGSSTTRRSRSSAAGSTEANLSEFSSIGRFAEAEPVLRRRLERDSTNVQLCGDLGAALKAQGREGEAGSPRASADS